MGELAERLERILALAKLVRKHIEERDIGKAAGELNELIRLDLGWFRHTEDRGNSDVLVFLYREVFSKAKKALRDLDASELTDEARSLVEELIVFLQKDAWKAKLEEEEKLDELHKFWCSEFSKTVFYHGTTSLALDKIRRYGLVPGMALWDEDDIARLHTLLIKAGWQWGVGVYYTNRTIKNGKGVFLTSKKETAANYANRSPEMWSEFVHAATWEARDYKKALKHFYYKLLYRGATKQSLRVEEYARLLDQFDTDKKSFSATVVRLCLLDVPERNEVLSIFNKYWDFFKKSRPIVLHISCHAPAILEGHPEFGSFKLFAKFFGSIESAEKAIQIARGSIAANIDIKISKRISPEFITKYEEV